MPEYRSNPFYGDPRVWKGAASLAEALAPNQMALAELDLAQAQAAAQIDRDYSGSYANQALAAERFAGADYSRAQTAEINAALAAAERLHETFQRADLDWDQKFTLASSYALQAGYEIDDLLPLLGTMGAGVDDIGLARLGAGTPFGDTPQGAYYATENELLQGVDYGTGQPRFLPRGQLGANPSFGPMMSETNAKGAVITRLPAEDQRRMTFSGVPTSEYYDEDLGYMTRGYTADTIGRPTAAPPTGGAGGAPEVTGTGAEADARRFLLYAQEQTARGVPLTAQEQQWLDFYLGVLAAEKTLLRDDGQGGVVPITMSNDVGMFSFTPPAPVAPPAPATPQPSATLGFGDRVLSHPLSYRFKPPAGEQTPQFSFLPAAPAQTVVQPPRAPAPTPASAPVQTQPPAQPQAPAPARRPAPPGNFTVGDPIPGINTAATKTPTSDAARTLLLSQSISAGARQLNALFGFNMETGEFADTGFRPDFDYAWRSMAGSAAQAMMGADMGDYVSNRLKNPQQEAFDALKQVYIEPLLRLRSGAATPVTEVATYARYLPTPGEEESTTRNKLLNMNITALAVEDVALRMNLDVDGLLAYTKDNPDHAAQIAGMVQDAEESIRALIAPGSNPYPPIVDPATPGQTEIPDTQTYQLPGGRTMRLVPPEVLQQIQQGATR